MKPNELRNMTIEELENRLREESQALFNLRFQAGTGQLQNKLKIRFVRRDIARIITILKQKERTEKTGKSK